MSFERRTVSYEGLVGALKERREQMGFTQMTLDQLIGWSDGTINKYEHFQKHWGKHLGAHSLPLILSALGLELVIREKGDHVAVYQPARFFGPGDAEWARLLARHENREPGTVADQPRPVMADDGQPVGAMSIAETAEMLGVSRNTVKAWIYDGLLESFKVNGAKQGRRLIRRAAVEAMLQAGRSWQNGGARIDSPPLAPDDQGEVLPAPSAQGAA